MWLCHCSLGNTEITAAFFELLPTRLIHNWQNDFWICTSGRRSHKWTFVWAPKYEPKGQCQHETKKPNRSENLGADPGCLGWHSCPHQGSSLLWHSRWLVSKVWVSSNRIFGFAASTSISVSVNSKQTRPKKALHLPERRSHFEWSSKNSVPLEHSHSAWTRPSQKVSVSAVLPNC